MAARFGHEPPLALTIPRVIQMLRNRCLAGMARREIPWYSRILAIGEREGCSSDCEVELAYLCLRNRTTALPNFFLTPLLWTRMTLPSTTQSSFVKPTHSLFDDSSGQW
jgi:hypothetical protein